MRLAERYAKFRQGSVARLRETLLRTTPAIPELELQSRWFAGEFGRDFKTVTGDDLEIVQFGVWNREAGPDFAEAAISLHHAPPARGCIEIDPDARDWERHGHATNADYENVVLHVFASCGDAQFFTRTLGHRNVPQLLLDLRGLESVPQNPSPVAKLGRCMAPLRDLPKARVGGILEAAAQFRLQKKAARIAALMEAHGADEALFQSLAETLGYKANKLQFTLLAQRLPLRLLRKNKRETDALLFGVSGFLPTRDLSGFEAKTRGYLRDLWEIWWARRTEFEHILLAKDAWRLTGARPANHPQRRVAALAQVLRHWPKVRALTDGLDTGAVRKFFHGLHDEYWDYHYTLASPKSRARTALVGTSRVTEMLANVFFPLAILRDPERWKSYCALPAALSNKRLETAAIRLFAGSPGDLLRTAAHQQGLLQIYEDFCMQDDSDCARCDFPRQLAHWR
ncbi:MAG: hypothetical protein QOD99_1697 [Chthoniobacter sp.]|jgi:hypothetical protein|nr:hypothetical protein [Chthoniobacter sp.]